MQLRERTKRYWKRLKRGCNKAINGLIKLFAEYKPTVPDLLIIAGIGLVSYGVYEIYDPAGYIALGVFLLVLGYPALVKEGD